MGQVNKGFPLTGEMLAIGDLLLAARKRKKMSQQQVADAANVTRITVSRYESRKWSIEPLFSHLTKIAFVLEISQTELIECLEMQSVKRNLSKRQKLGAKALKRVQDASGLMIEAQVSLQVVKLAAKKQKEAANALTELLETLKQAEEDDIPERADSEVI